MTFWGFENVMFLDFRVDFRVQREKNHCLFIFQMLETCPESDQG